MSIRNVLGLGIVSGLLLIGSSLAFGNGITDTTGEPLEVDITGTIVYESGVEYGGDVYTEDGVKLANPEVDVFLIDSEENDDE